jgi:hypothetical protein
MKVLPEWRNWQTQQTQNLPGITPRVGSTPSSGTIFLLGNFSTFLPLTPSSRPAISMLKTTEPMSSLSSNLTAMNNRRRSQRVLLRIPITVVGRGPDKKPVAEDTFTAVVNAHGGLIYLSLKVSLGQVIIIKNPETGEELSCRVVYLNPAPDGRTEVGVEFVKAAPNFWRVAFPPSDWVPRNPDITADTF